MQPGEQNRESVHIRFMSRSLKLANKKRDEPEPQFVRSLIITVIGRNSRANSRKYTNDAFT